MDILLSGGPLNGLTGNVHPPEEPTSLFFADAGGARFCGWVSKRNDSRYNRGRIQYDRGSLVGTTGMRRYSYVGTWEVQLGSTDG